MVAAFVVLGCMLFACLLSQPVVAVQLLLVLMLTQPTYSCCSAFLCLHSGNPGKTFLCSPVLLTGAAAAVSFSASMPGKCPVVVPHSLSIGHSQSQTYLFICTLWLVDRSFQSGRESHMPFIEVDACIYKVLPINGPLV